MCEEHNMKLHASGEDYLEAILVLKKKLDMVRSVDVARHMGCLLYTSHGSGIGGAGNPGKVYLCKA